MNPSRCRSRRRINALSAAQIIIEMLRDAVTLHELVQTTGLSIKTVRGYVLTLHKLGGCHIAQWEQDRRGTPRIPAWSLGRKRDAVKLRKSKAEINRSYRARAALLRTLRTLEAAPA